MSRQFVFDLYQSIQTWNIEHVSHHPEYWSQPLTNERIANSVFMKLADVISKLTFVKDFPRFAFYPPYPPDQIVPSDTLFEIIIHPHDKQKKLFCSNPGQFFTSLIEYTEENVRLLEEFFTFAKRFIHRHKVPYVFQFPDEDTNNKWGYSIDHVFLTILFASPLILREGKGYVELFCMNQELQKFVIQTPFHGLIDDTPLIGGIMKAHFGTGPMIERQTESCSVFVLLLFYFCVLIPRIDEWGKFFDPIEKLHKYQRQKVHHWRFMKNHEKMTEIYTNVWTGRGITRYRVLFEFCMIAMYGSKARELCSYMQVYADCRYYLIQAFWDCLCMDTLYIALVSPHYLINILLVFFYKFIPRSIINRNKWKKICFYYPRGVQSMQIGPEQNKHIQLFLSKLPQYIVANVESIEYPESFKPFLMEDQYFKLFISTAESNASDLNPKDEDLPPPLSSSSSTSSSTRKKRQRI